ncbi:MAG: hypothetical protein SGPRY_013867, partial [Prymnesium sp.]
FKVKFVGEASDDHGGPYREALTNSCTELQSDASPLFVLCPNGKHGLGLNRSSYLIRPSATDESHLAQFAFFGKLMGCALLQKQASLDLELCSHFWKTLVSTDLDASDLREFDDAEYNSLQRLRYIDVTDGIDADLFGDLFFNTFEVTLSDGTMELIEDGSSKDVTFYNRHRFCDLAIAARLEEGRVQCRAVLDGLRSVADIDLEMLKRHTSYGASITNGANEPHVKIFWQARDRHSIRNCRMPLTTWMGGDFASATGDVCSLDHIRKVLQDLDADERRMFLTFAWGRNRLPLTDADWGGNTMKIHTLETPRPGGHFP